MSIDSSTSTPIDGVGTTSAPGPRPRSRRRNTNVARWIGLGLLLVVIAVIASTFRRGAFTFYKHVDEVMADPARWYGAEVRVEGRVQRGSIEHHAGSQHYEFVVERNGRSVRVVFDGLPPDTFRDDVDATVRGRLQRNNVFVANEIATRCPSRYEMQNRRQQGEQPPAGMPGHVPAATP